MTGETVWEIVARLIEIICERSKIKYPMSSGQFLRGISTPLTLNSYQSTLHGRYNRRGYVANNPDGNLLLAKKFLAVQVR